MLIYIIYIYIEIYIFLDVKIVEIVKYVMEQDIHLFNHLSYNNLIHFIFIL